MRLRSDLPHPGASGHELFSHTALNFSTPHLMKLYVTQQMFNIVRMDTERSPAYWDKRCVMVDCSRVGTAHIIVCWSSSKWVGTHVCCFLHALPRQFPCFKQMQYFQQWERILSRLSPGVCYMWGRAITTLEFPDNPWRSCVKTATGAKSKPDPELKLEGFLSDTFGLWWSTKISGDTPRGAALGL